MIFMDCQMPVMDGLETVRRIRAQETSGRRLPIVALTAHVLNGGEHHVLAAGMDDYLAKPFTPQSLVETIERWISPDTADLRRAS